VSHALDLIELLRRNAALEDDLIRHYAEATRFCLLIGDADNEGFFEALWQDEHHHGQELAAWLASLGADRRDDGSRAWF